MLKHSDEAQLQDLDKIQTNMYKTLSKLMLVFYLLATFLWFVTKLKIILILPGFQKLDMMDNMIQPTSLFRLIQIPNVHLSLLYCHLDITHIII